MADIEKIVAFNAIRSYLNNEDQNNLIDKLGLNKKTIENRIKGLKFEDEFYLILSFLKACKHMISFDESASVLTQSFQPDMITKLNNGEILFIEIKSVKDEKYQISGGNFQKKIDFANEIGFPLYFAINIKDYWHLFSSDYLKSKNGKIEFPYDIIESKFNRKFNSFFFQFPKGITVESVYSMKDDAIGGGIQHEKYNNLISYKFMFNDNIIFQADQNNDEKAIYSIILENLHDVMSNQSQIISRLDEDKVKITEKLTSSLVMPDYFFFLSSIKHTINQFGLYYDSTLFMKQFLEDRKKFFDKDHIEAVIKDLIKMGVPIKIVNKVESIAPDGQINFSLEK